MTITGNQLIAGKAVHAGDGTFTSVDPRTKTPGDVTFYEATPEEVDRAVRAAAEAYKTTRTYPPAELADFLDRCADEIEALGDELLETGDTETALGLPRLSSERARTTGQLRKFGDLLREGSYVEAIIDTAQGGRPDIRRMRFPIGPVAVFTPNNFPLAFGVAGGDTASAFAAGCPVILKGHPSHPGTSELVAQAINRAIAASGFPVGFFSLLQGASIDVGQTLVKHSLLEAVAFTGSQRGGRAIYNTAAERPRPIPVYAEMGSINPVLVLPGAIKRRADEVADMLVSSVTLGTGQFCTNPGLVLVEDSPETQAFIKLVSEKMGSTEPGFLLNAAVERGLVEAVTDTAAHENVQTLIGGQTVKADGYCYAHTVLKTTSRAFRDDESLQTEHFGPVTLFVLCESTQDMKATIGALHGNLTATVHAEDDELETAGELFHLLREKVGRLIWNGMPTGVAVVYSMMHGGPYPASTDAHFTSVGMTAIQRFTRPVAMQNIPDPLLPDALKNANPLNIWRVVDEKLTRGTI